jgi:hypothetical protein
VQIDPVIKKPVASSETTQDVLGCAPKQWRREGDVDAPICFPIFSQRLPLLIIEKAKQPAVTKLGVKVVNDALR